MLQVTSRWKDMIVDTHVHIWEIAPPKYPLGPTISTWNHYPKQPGTAEELIKEMDDHKVDWTVIVQSSWSTWDNSYIADSVQSYPNRLIGHGLIDPQIPNNADKIGYWVKDKGLSGFRFHPIYYPKEKVLIKPQNKPMWDEISSVGAVVQFHVNPMFADQLAVIAKLYPNIIMIIDHLGYPNVKKSLLDYMPILELAKFPNIFLKLSDVAGRSTKPFPFEDVHPFIKKAIEAFSVQRTMWGTGFPGDHRVKNNWLPLSKELSLIREGLPFLSSTDREHLLGITASKIWSLP